MGMFDHIQDASPPKTDGVMFSHISDGPEASGTPKQETDSTPWYKKAPLDVIRSAAAPIVKPIGSALEFVGDKTNKYAAAPTRAAVSKLQDDATDIGGALSAAKNQFGNDPSLAPTGKDLAIKAGASTTPISESVPGAFSTDPNSWLPKKGGTFDVSPAGVYGAGLEATLDPSTPLIGAAAGSAGKLAGVAARAAKSAGVVDAIAGAGESLAKSASNSALKTIGAGKSAFLKYGAKSEDIYNLAKNENIIGMGSNVKSVAQKSGEVMNDAGSKIGEIFNQLDASGHTFNRAEVAKNIEDAVKGKLGKGLDQKKALESVNEYLNDFKQGGEVASGSEVQALRQDLDRRANFERGPTKSTPLSDTAFTHARNAANGEIMAKADMVGGDLGNQLREQNKRYHLSSIINHVSESKAAALEANHAFSLQDFGAGAVLSHNPAVAIPTVVASKAARTFGPGLMTKGLDTAAEGAKGLARTMDAISKAPMSFSEKRAAMAAALNPTNNVSASLRAADNNQPRRGLAESLGDR